MRRLYGLIAVILVLGLLVACGSRLPGPRTIILGPRVTSVTTPTDLNAGDSWTFVATVTGSPVTGWNWNFDGGATPNTSTAMSPTVVLVNPSTTDDATYNASVTVVDADARSYTYNFTFTVGETLNQAPVFVGLPASITGDFTFSINDLDGDDVAIALTLVSGNVAVSPLTIAATSANYGPFNISVSNMGVEDEVVSIDISLDDGINDPVVDNVGGTVAGVDLDPDGIYILAPASVNVGDTFTVTVYASAVPNELLQLSSIMFNYGGDDATRADYANWPLTVDPDSWDLGAVNDAGVAPSWTKDGSFWEAYTPPVFVIGARLFSWDDYNPDPALVDTPWANISVNVSTGAVAGGAPIGSSGPLFNINFTANAVGPVDLTFVEADTYYADSGGTEHGFTIYTGATVTVN